MHRAAARCQENFYPRPPRGGRPFPDSSGTLRWPYFYPRPPRGGRLECIGPRHGAKKISIHALREEGDGHRQGSGAGAGHFYPRPPRGGRRSSPPPGHRWSRYFYPRPPRGGRRLRSLSNLLSHLQNFYPRPLRGGRPDRRCRRVPARPISIHALCEEGDVEVSDGKGSTSLFLSTPSARRATVILKLWQYRLQNFYPRPLRGGRQACGASPLPAMQISIHALCEEGDAKSTWPDVSTRISIHALCEEGDGTVCLEQSRTTYFYPRPLRGGRRSGCPASRCCRRYFYPRPLRGGRPARPGLQRQGSNFYPRPLRGGRLAYALIGSALIVFLSTPSARRATYAWGAVTEPEQISIHALCEEGDPQTQDEYEYIIHFYPRPLRGGRHACTVRRAQHGVYFYPRPLRGGRPNDIEMEQIRRNFYPRPLRGGRPMGYGPCGHRSSNFYPRPLRGGRHQEIYAQGNAQDISIHALCEEGD